MKLFPFTLEHSHFCHLSFALDWWFVCNARGNLQAGVFRSASNVVNERPSKRLHRRLCRAAVCVHQV